MKSLHPLSKARRGELKQLENRLSYSFKESRLLEEALTHRSYMHETSKAGKAGSHNERLEFLGDAVLELAISHLLMQDHSRFQEGYLSKIRAALVNRDCLTERAHRIELGNYLRLGKGEEHAEGRHKSSLLSDAYEAVLGAIYLDRGYEKAFDVIRQQFKDLLAQVEKDDFIRDYKTQLQEKIQLLFRTVPRYVLKSATGPDHDKLFEVELWINKNRLASGVGKTKKLAEQAAAEKALRQL